MQQYVVANWKMYIDHDKAHHLASGLATRVMESDRPLPKVVLCPSHPYLIPVYHNIKGTTVELGAQNCHPEKAGPHTGEVSVAQVKDVNAKYVIVGHSERRSEHHETSEHIRKKVEAIMNHGMCAILCVGESEEEHKKGMAFEKVAGQLKTETPGSFSPEQLIIAYEPLWCIAADRTPSKQQIEEMHGVIRYELQQLQPNGNLVPVLYGGSVTAKNAGPILGCEGVHGVLLGRHGLKLDDLWAIINSSEG